MGEMLYKEKDISEVENYYIALYGIAIGTFSFAQSGTFSTSTTWAWKAYKKIFEIIDNKNSNEVL